MNKLPLYSFQFCSAGLISRATPGQTSFLKVDVWYLEQVLTGQMAFLSPNKWLQSNKWRKMVSTLWAAAKQRHMFTYLYFWNALCLLTSRSGNSVSFNLRFIRWRSSDSESTVVFSASTSLSLVISWSSPASANFTSAFALHVHIRCKFTRVDMLQLKIERTDRCCSETESVTAQMCSGRNRTEPNHTRRSARASCRRSRRRPEICRS